jgi:hypothetical protein
MTRRAFRRPPIPPRLRPPAIRSALAVAFVRGDSIATLARRYRVNGLVIERVLRGML